MKRIPDQSIDMILCDLPYGTTACKWDTVIPFELLWEQYERIAKFNAAIVLFGSQPFTSNLITSNLKFFKYCWEWKKSKGSNFPHAPNMPLKIIEDIAVFSKANIGHVSQLGDNRMRYYPQGIKEGTTVVKQNQNTSELKYHRESQTNHTSGYKCKSQGYPTTLLEFKSEGKSVHPTQKPVPLFEYLIKTYTCENEVVLDNCVGSGTTVIAAINTNRKFIGIEKDEKYYQLANNRMNDALRKDLNEQV